MDETLTRRGSKSAPHTTANPDTASRRRGFTLVELLVVIGIIALLMSILMPALGRAREHSRAVACLANLRQILAACQNYATDNQGFIIPAQWNATINNPRPLSESLAGDEAWCNILVNQGYAQAPDGSLGWTTNLGPRRQSIFFCPSGFDDFAGPPTFNNFGVPASRADTRGGMAVRYYSLNKRIPRRPDRIEDRRTATAAGDGFRVVVVHRLVSTTRPSRTGTSVPRHRQLIGQHCVRVRQAATPASSGSCQGLWLSRR